MSLKRRTRPDAEINVGSFSDIAFLLIIFFILTTTFVKLAGTRVDVPSGMEDPASEKQKTPTVSLSATGILWGEKQQELTLEQLQAVLIGMDFPNRDPSKRVVIVNTAADVPYQLFFDVVVAIRNAEGVLGQVVEGEGGGDRL